LDSRYSINLAGDSLSETLAKAVSLHIISNS